MAKKIYTREMILDGALELSKEVGFKSISMRMLAKHLGCSVMPIYDAFDSKDELLDELIVYSFEEAMVFHSKQSIQERYLSMLESGLRHPEYFLETLHVGPMVSDLPDKMAPLYAIMRKDSRLRMLTDQQLRAINGRIEFVIIGLAHLYLQTKYDDIPVDFAREYLMKTIDIVIKGIK